MKPSRIIELDALRAIAALNLMLFHFTHVYSVKYGYDRPLGFEFPWGKYGVQLFFMLSGLVNALTILRKREPGTFLASRALRILPCYYIVLALNLLLFQLMPLAANEPWTWPQLMANLTVLPNLFGYECFEPVMWTLQVEVLFYGILIFLFTRGWLDRPVPTIAVGLIVCVSGCWAIDSVTARLPQESFAFGYWNMVRQLFLLDYFPLFAVGILIHEVWRTSRSGELRPLKGVKQNDFVSRETKPRISSFLMQPNQLANITAIGASLIAFHLIDPHGHNPVVSIGLTLLLGLSVFQKVPVLRYSGFVFVSGISYMLYLIHDNLGTVLIYWLNNHLGVPSVVCFLAAIPFAIIVATAAAYGLERPLTRFLRNRLVVSRTIDSQECSQSLQRGAV